MTEVIHFLFLKFYNLHSDIIECSFTHKDSCPSVGKCIVQMEAPRELVEVQWVEVEIDYNCSIIEHEGPGYSTHTSL